jgi:isoleucyl-tRNA synthetase
MLKEYGAEILRLWAAAEDYTNDIRISPVILKRLVESYRKIRNTCRFLLGNLYDFSAAEALRFEELKNLDKFILLKWQECLGKIYDGYNDYQFHIFFHAVMNFCTNDLSSFYLDIIKDRLYSSLPNSRERKSTQTAIFIIARELATVISPVLSFTADEIWEYLPKWEGMPETVFEAFFPERERFSDELTRRKFDRLLSVRKAVNRALERARADKIIGHSLDATLIIGVKTGKEELLSLDEELSRLLIVSEAEVRDFEQVGGTVEDGVAVLALASTASKCERCWSRSKEVNESRLCPRCAAVIKQLQG